MRINRRHFIKTALLSTMGVLTGSSLAWDDTLNPDNTYYPVGGELDQVKDLVLWAPFQAFLPGENDLTLDSPNDGTRMGVLKAADILKGESMTLRYWHGHSGKYHQVTLTPEHFDSLKSNNPVVLTVPTTVLDGHFHVLVIDPKKTAS